MEVAGNPWLEAWNNAKPVPARRQKRLFDDTREAEKVGFTTLFLSKVFSYVKMDPISNFYCACKVLEFLTALTPGEVAQLLLPNALHAALERILAEQKQDEQVLRNVG